MKRIWTYIISLFIKPTCKHPNLVEWKWIGEDNTCMIGQECRDCGFLDYGHVYVQADPETWLE